MSRFPERSMSNAFRQWGVVVLALAASSLAWGQDYPAKPVRVVVPYPPGGPTDVMGGQVQMMFDSTPSAIPFVKSGKLRALAVTTAKRTGAAPDIPSMAESGLPGFDHSNWYGVWGPPAMPREIVNKLTLAIATTMQKKEVRDKLVELGADPVDAVTPAQFEAYAQSELARFARIVKQAGVKME